MVLGKLFDELKRRNVFRVAVAYIVSAWLVLQVADVVINNIGAPEWVFSVFMLAGGLLFLPILFFSWAYELTPEGVKREAEVDRSQSITSNTGRKLNVITIAMLVAVVGFVLVSDKLPSEDSIDSVSSDAAGEVVVTTVDDKSIAVLAFDDLSPGGDQAFFAEGLSEEILNVLAQVPGLKVAGRTSSFAFKGSDTDLREIGEVLNVAHILEGSVRKAGDRIRVTAQLIQASDGFHLFSRTYDRNLVDVFAVQDEIAALIGTALQAELGGEVPIRSSTPTSIEAYDLYLLARQRIRSRNPILMEEAMEMLDNVLAIDQDYAPALVQRALVVFLLSDTPGAYGDIPQTVAVRQAYAFLEKALQLEPEMAEAHAVKGLLQSTLVGDLGDSMASLRHALEINPNLENASLWLANNDTDINEVITLYEQMIHRDPLYRPAFNNLIQVYLGLAKFDKSDALVSRVSRITGPDDSVRQALGSIAYMRGELAEAARNLQFALEINPNASIVRVWVGYTMLQLGEMERAVTDGVFSVSLVALAKMGDFAVADQMLRTTDFMSGDQWRKVRHAADYLASVRRTEEMLDIVTTNYGGAESLLEALPSSATDYGSEYLGPLAYVYLLEDRQDEFLLIKKEMRATLDAIRAAGADNWYYWYSEAQYAALDADADAAIGHLKLALDKGFVSVTMSEPLFDLLEDDERYQSIVRAALERANEERAKLGMGPYRPIMASN